MIFGAESVPYREGPDNFGTEKVRARKTTDPWCRRTTRSKWRTLSTARAYELFCKNTVGTWQATVQTPYKRCSMSARTKFRYEKHGKSVQALRRPVRDTKNRMGDLHTFTDTRRTKMKIDVRHDKFGKYVCAGYRCAETKWWSIQAHKHRQSRTQFEKKLEKYGTFIA